MPLNHGIYRKLPTTACPGQKLSPAEAMVFRCGILQIFEGLRTGPFLTSSDEQQRASQLEYHIRTLFQRFIFSLQNINRLMHELVACYGDDGSPPRTMAIQFEAECQADHVLTYLNTMVDDVAQVIILATGATHPNRRIESMGDLKHPTVVHLSALTPVKTLLLELDQAVSWWDLAFKPKKGARQLLIHNQHLVQFQGASLPGEPFKAQAFLISPFSRSPFHDFFSLLRDILSGLFGWLDRLEIALTGHLCTRSSGWSPKPTCPVFFLPIGFPLGDTRFDADYFALPLCDGSDPLPWTVSVS